MAAEGNEIASLLSEFSEPDEKVDELFPDDAAQVYMPLGSDRKAEEISPEDAAWVESCLVGGSELSDDNWSALREALLDTLDTRATAFESLTFADVDEMQEENEECAHLCEEVKVCFIHGEEQFLSDGQEGDDDSNAEASVDPGEDFEYPHKIFRVWDLETVDEEDELIKQLKKAIAESPHEDVLPSLDDPSATLNEETLDELIAGIADLSLKPFDD